MVTEPTKPADLLVIGGGINGVGVARDAAGRGLSVVLAEKDDLGEGTSSRTGKYIHGGLRYLEYYEFRLVREALIEREVLLAAAPHVTWPLRLILPHSPEQRPRWLIQLGLFLYDHLGGRKRIPASGPVNLSSGSEGEVLRAPFRKGFAYYDCWVDDARLVVLNARDAAARGATVLTRTAVVATRREGDLWRATLRDSDSGETRTLHARAVFNAGGPWVERVLGTVAGVNAHRRIRLVKGSHIITKRWWQGTHGYVLQNTDRRLIFVNPYQDDLALVGTTDIPFDGRPEDAAIDGGEIDYLCTILNRYFDLAMTPDQVLASFSGVRPLFDDDSTKNASAVTRDYEFDLSGGDGQAPILSAFGGKLTTYRKLAEHGLERLKPFFPTMGRPWTAGTPLPGGELPNADLTAWVAEFAHRHAWLPASLARHYAQTYGTDATLLLDGAKATADLGRHFGGLLYEIELQWAVEREWARRGADVLERRTKHGLFLTVDERRAVAHWLADARRTAA